MLQNYWRNSIVVKIPVGLYHWNLHCFCSMGALKKVSIAIILHRYRFYIMMVALIWVICSVFLDSSELAQFSRSRCYIARRCRRNGSIPGRSLLYLSKTVKLFINELGYGDKFYFFRAWRVNRWAIIFGTKVLKVHKVLRSY